MQVDHLVLWVADPLRSVAWYDRILGAAGVRIEEFQRGEVPFPSVRLSADTLLDLMPIAAAPAMNRFPGAEGSAGHKVNHLCLAFDRAGFEALRTRLTEAGTPPAFVMKDSFGARGRAPEAFYFADPDGNVLEARYYA